MKLFMHALTHMQVRLIWALVMAFAAILFAVGFNIWYTNSAVRSICGLITAQTDVYETTPPATESGKKVREALENYGRELGCK